jgi:hypothetical protein
MFGWLGFRLFLLREALFALPFSHVANLLGGYSLGCFLQVFWFRKILKGALKAAGIGGGGGKKTTAKQAD